MVLDVLSGASARCMTLRFTSGGELLQRISAGVVLLVAAVLARAGSEQAVLRNTCCATFRFPPAADLLEQSCHDILFYPSLDPQRIGAIHGEHRSSRRHAGHISPNRDTAGHSLT